jgi:hypothetical protein
VNLSCALTNSPSGATEVPTCGVPSTVTISGTTAATATLTIFTTAATSGALDLPLKGFFLGGGGGVLALVLLFGIPARRRAWRALFSVLALVVIAGAIGCGGDGGRLHGDGHRDRRGNREGYFQCGGDGDGELEPGTGHRAPGTEHRAKPPSVLARGTLERCGWG